MFGCERNGYDSYPNIAFNFKKFVAILKERDLPVQVIITVLVKVRDEVKAHFSPFPCVENMHLCHGLA